MAILGEPVTHNSNFEEGRRPNSRASSHDSDSSPRTRTALLAAADSGDEADTLTAANNVETGSDAEAPLVRPPVVPVWGGSAFSGFYQRNTSSPFHHQPQRNSPRPESDVGRDDSSESTPAPGYPTGEPASDTTIPISLRAEDSRKTSIPSLLISSASNLSPVPSSLHDFSSPHAMGYGSGLSFPLTPDSATPASNAGPSNPSTSAGSDRPSPPPPVSSVPASSNQTSTHSGAPGRGRGAKRGTKPGAKRGEWRVKNYAGNTISANGEQVQPADPSTYSSFFKVAPPPVPAVEPDPPNVAQNGNGNHQVASSSNLRLQVPSDVHPGHLSRSVSPREHPIDNDDYNINAGESSQYQRPPSPQPVPDVIASGVQPPRLVAIVIEDKRYGCTEPQLVEIHVPVTTRTGGSLWVEATDVCEALQKGPSRIDGPAKVFTYRAQQYRQYFLRVSIDNRDTYAPANLEITQKRVLRAYVEPDVPPRTVVMDQSDPNSATNLYRSPVQHPSGYLASPATPSASDYGRSPVDFHNTSRNLLKRNYDCSASHISPSPPIPSSGSGASKKPRRQQSSSNA